MDQRDEALRAGEALRGELDGLRRAQREREAELGRVGLLRDEIAAHRRERAALTRRCEELQAAERKLADSTERELAMRRRHEEELERVREELRRAELTAGALRDRLATSADAAQHRLATQQNQELARKVEELTVLQTKEEEEIYDALLSVATLMARAGNSSSSSEETERELRLSTEDLVRRALAGRGCSPRELKEHQAAVYAGLFAAFSRAARGDEEAHQAHLMMMLATHGKKEKRHRKWK